MAEAEVPFGSVYIALPTMLDERGRVDEKSLDHVVDYVLARDVAGIALFTEASEDPLLSNEERRQLLERVGKRAKDKKPLLVVVSALSTREAVDLARLGEQNGAVGIAIAPLSAPGLGYRELYRHVDRVARGTKLPTYLTVRPANAFDQLKAEELATLAQHESLRGVYLPQGTPTQIKPWAKRLKGKNAQIFSGCALSFPSASRAGATAVICGLTMIAPDQAKKLMEALKKNDAEAERAIEKQIGPALELLGPPLPAEEEKGVKKLASKIAQQSLSSPLSASVPFALIKEGLKLQGHPVGSFVRPPYEQASATEIDRLRAVMRSSGLIS